MISNIPLISQEPNIELPADSLAAAAALNRGCLCRSVDRDRLRQALEEGESSAAGDLGFSYESLLATRPHLFSDTMVFVAQTHLQRMAELIAAITRVIALPAYREATRTQMQIGYFITKDMKTDLDASVLRGVTPVVLATVSLMGGTVLNVNAMPAGPYQAVRVDYRNAAGDSNTVIYVCGDLSNGGFRNYRAFLDSYGRGSTYFKAASYLMHDDYFSQARDYFLAASNNVIEDDSGIPYRFFAPGQWDVHCYGNYEAPIPLFAKHMQNDLREAYLAVPNRPLLPFGSGYHYATETANLIHAVRR